MKNVRSMTATSKEDITAFHLVVTEGAEQGGSWPLADVWVIPDKVGCIVIVRDIDGVVAFDRGFIVGDRGVSAETLAIKAVQRRVHQLTMPMRGGL